MTIEPIQLIIGLLQQLCIYMVVAYLLSRTRIFIPLTHGTIRLPSKIACYVIFSAFCIMGTLIGLPVSHAIANTPAIGAVLSGLLGGPLVGLAVGVTGGLHRYSLGGAFALAAGIDIVVQGLLGGIVHRWLVRRSQIKKLYDPTMAGVLTFCGVVLELLIDLAVAKPFEETLRTVSLIALPELIANSFGAAMFMGILQDRRELIETQSSAFSAKALAIAARADGILRTGFNQENSMTVARIIYEETGVGAVAITDREKILAFIGIGDDHHLPDTPISSKQTQQAIANNQVIYADGSELSYQCSLSPTCRLGAALVIPLVGEGNQVIGAIKLYEPKSKLFLTINRTLGEGIAKLLSNQILAGQYEQQKALLAQSEIKLLHAQVNPHFLFNALNTIAAVASEEPERVRDLIGNLSTFFRSNLKRPSEEAYLFEEVEHVNAYLQIELARFSDRLSVEIDVPDELRLVRLPAFSLQPIVENAIKHGTAHLLRAGSVRISAKSDGHDLMLAVEDDAGLYEPRGNGKGLGVALVDRRIKNRCGAAYGVTTECERNVFTRVTIRIPMEVINA